MFAKKAKISQKMCKFHEKIYANISEEIYVKKTGWEIINYDIRKLKMLSTQSRELSTFFAQLIAAATTLMVFADFFREISHIFLFFSLNWFSRKNLGNTDENFRIFSQKFYFNENPTLYIIVLCLSVNLVSYPLYPKKPSKRLNLSGP